MCDGDDRSPLGSSPATWWSASARRGARTTPRPCRSTRDLRAQQRSGCGSSPSRWSARSTLDLRSEPTAAAVRLLHRLARCSASTGAHRGRTRPRHRHVPGDRGGCAWQPELAVAVVERRVWGTTVAAAATAQGHRVRRRRPRTWPTSPPRWSAACSPTCPRRCPRCCGALDDQAALDADVGHLMAALPALVRAVALRRRPGHRRRRPARGRRRAGRADLRRPAAAVGGLDDDAAARLRDQVDAVHAAVAPARAATRPGAARAGAVARPLVPAAGRRDVPRPAGRPAHPAAAGRRAAGSGRGGRPAAPRRCRRRPGRGRGRLGGGFPGRRRPAAGPRRRAARAARRLGRGPAAEQEFDDVLPLLRRTFGAFDRAGAARTSAGRSRSSAAAAPMAPASCRPVDRDRAAAVLPHRGHDPGRCPASTPGADGAADPARSMDRALRRWRLRWTRPRRRP